MHAQGISVKRGKRELFEGLAISKTNWAWESWLVIHLDMSKVETDNSVDDRQYAGQNKNGKKIGIAIG